MLLHRVFFEMGSGPMDNFAFGALVSTCSGVLLLLNQMSLSVQMQFTGFPKFAITLLALRLLSVGVEQRVEIKVGGSAGRTGV